MKKLGIIIPVVLLALILFFGGSASAQIANDLPDGIEVFWVDGHTIVRDTEFGTMIYWCTGECGDSECPTPTPVPTPTPPTPTPPTPPPTDTPTPPTPTPVPLTYCHCEQGEGEGALSWKNCHVAKYNNGHANHEWDFWSTDGTCDGWHH